METTTNISKAIPAVTADGWFKKQVSKFEAARFGWMTLYITIQSCLGSIACSYILENKASDLMLAASAAITMVCNAIFIAQGPGRWCLLSFYISVILNSIFVLLNI